MQWSVTSQPHTMCKIDGACEMFEKCLRNACEMIAKCLRKACRMLAKACERVARGLRKSLRNACKTLEFSLKFAKKTLRKMDGADLLIRLTHKLGAAHPATAAVRSFVQGKEPEEQKRISPDELLGGTVIPAESITSKRELFNCVGCFLPPTVGALSFEAVKGVSTSPCFFFFFPLLLILSLHSLLQSYFYVAVSALLEEDAAQLPGPRPMQPLPTPEESSEGDHRNSRKHKLVVKSEDQREHGRDNARKSKKHTSTRKDDEKPKREDTAPRPFPWDVAALYADHVLSNVDVAPARKLLPTWDAFAADSEPATASDELLQAIGVSSGAPFLLTTYRQNVWETCLICQEVCELL